MIFLIPSLEKKKSKRAYMNKCEYWKISVFWSDFRLGWIDIDWNFGWANDFTDFKQASDNKKGQKSKLLILSFIHGFSVKISNFSWLWSYNSKSSEQNRKNICFSIFWCIDRFFHLFKWLLNDKHIAFR